MVKSTEGLHNHECQGQRRFRFIGGSLSHRHQYRKKSATAPANTSRNIHRAVGARDERSQHRVMQYFTRRAMTLRLAATVSALLLWTTSASTQVRLPSDAAVQAMLQQLVNSHGIR